MSIADRDLLRYDSLEQHFSPAERKKELLRIIKAAEIVNDNYGLSDAHRRLGIVFRNYGRPDWAIAETFQSLRFGEKANYLESVASSLNQLAVLYKETGNSRSAMTYFEKAAEIYKKGEGYTGLSDAYYNIAELNFDLGDSIKAEALCHASMDYCNQVKNTVTMAYNYGLLSRIRLKQKKNSDAIKLSLAATSMLRNSDEVDGLIAGCVQTGKCYQQLGIGDKAVFYYREAYGLAVRQQHKALISKTAMLLSEFFEQQHSGDSSLHYLKRYVSNETQLANELASKYTIDALVHYDTEKKEMELFNRQKIILALTVCIVLLFIIILVIMLYFRQRKRIQKKESELSNANALIRGQDLERERIARELHDRVGSMLSTMKLHCSAAGESPGSSVQYNEGPYGKVMHLLDDTYEEVRRISHDLDTGLLSRFGFRAAVLQLIQLIESSNKLRVRFIDNGLDPLMYRSFETDIYRITQELLNNTIKYAHATEISIQLSRNNGSLVYSYEDDGRGFEKNALAMSTGIGYKNIDIRVKKIHASWHLDTSPGNGINLIIEIPLHGKD